MKQAEKEAAEAERQATFKTTGEEESMGAEPSETEQMQPEEETEQSDQEEWEEPPQKRHRGGTTKEDQSVPTHIEDRTAVETALTVRDYTQDHGRAQSQPPMEPAVATIPKNV